jgi:hypothetical protein
VGAGEEFAELQIGVNLSVVGQSVAFLGDSSLQGRLCEDDVAEYERRKRLTNTSHGDFSFLVCEGEWPMRRFDRSRSPSDRIVRREGYALGVAYGGFYGSSENEFLAELIERKEDPAVT